ncbi:MAG: NAD+ synthase [Chloroflexota bacterium]
MRPLRLGMAQINPTVGDFAGNRDRILRVLSEARSSGVELLTFPELAVCGYPPEDLLFKPHFIRKNWETLQDIIPETSGLTVVLGFAHDAGDIYNAAAIIHDGRLVDVYHKIFLPNYGVFDENRYFRAGNECPVYLLGDTGIGVNICEDIWYEAGPATVQANAGAAVILNISASPYYHGRRRERERMLASRAADNVAIVAYNNLVGGQDELIFDGDSLVFDEEGRQIAGGKQFTEELVIVDLDVEAVFRRRLHDSRRRKGAPPLEEYGWQEKKVVIAENLPELPRTPLPPQRPPRRKGFPAEVYEALVLGTRDYVRKNGFAKVLIGLSGGIDSALVAVIAVDALGKQNVTGVAMPSRYSSEGSLTDAAKLAQNLGIRLLTIPIEPVMQAYLKALEESLRGTEPGVAEENIQARIRGNYLMALSNKFGWLVLTTGNKSEMATGYSTLYGDMAGGFAVIKDVPKTMVYDLVKYRNSRGGKGVIPAAIVSKAPSAELRPDQKDTDTLPPYEQLDAMLTSYVEEDESIEQLVARGFAPEIVRQMARLVDTSEYKRRQAPPGIKITPRAFGRDRRLPITNRFREW